MKFFSVTLITILVLFLQLVYATNGNKCMKRTIMIDLDGVLDNYTKYTDEIPEIRKGAKDFIKQLSKDYKLILFTTRSPMKATKWLQDNKIDRYFIDVTNIKSPAYIYLDDRTIKFEGDYNKALNDINNFRVYWQK